METRLEGGLLSAEESIRAGRMERLAETYALRAL